jgi:hypothetical protein
MHINISFFLLYIYSNHMYVYLFSFLKSETAATAQYPHQLNIHHHTKNPPTPKTPSLMQLTFRIAFPFLASSSCVVSSSSSS